MLSPEHAGMPGTLTASDVRRLFSTRGTDPPFLPALVNRPAKYTGSIGQWHTKRLVMGSHGQMKTCASSRRTRKLERR